MNPLDSNLKKTDFCNSRSVNFQHFPHFPNPIVPKMRKVQIPHDVGSIMNLIAMVFVDFVSVEQFTPISRCFEKTS